MITTLQRRIAKSSGNPYARVEVEDLAGSIEVMFFGKAYQPISTVLAEDLVVAIKGRLQRRDDGAVSISAQEMIVPELDGEAGSGPVVLTVPSQRASEKVVTQLGEVLRRHRGSNDVHVQLLSGDKVEVMRLGAHYQVTPSPSLYGDLKVLLGPSCLQG